jgi:hypothetical protein
MPIESNASTGEKSSPFYIANEKLCQEWEAFILDREGKISGFYNAWSLDIKTKVKGEKTWLIDVWKSTYSQGFIFFAPNYENVQQTLKFTTRFFKTGCRNFKINKRGSFRGWSKSHPFAQAIIALLKIRLIDQGIYEVRFRDSELTITIHDRNDSFELAEELLNFDWKASH